MKDESTPTQSNTSISNNVSSFNIKGEDSYSLSFLPKYEIQEWFDTSEEVITGKKIKPYEDPVIKFNQTMKGMDYVNTMVWNGITYLPRTFVTSVSNSVQWLWNQLPSINLPIAMAKENNNKLILNIKKININVDRGINRDKSSTEGKKVIQQMDSCCL